VSALLESALLPTYPQPRVAFVEGDGAWLTAADGRRYLDFAAGIAVVSLGHRHPAPLAAAHAQLDRLWHASNLFASEPAYALAAALSARFGGAQAFFCNSGAEANEAALKYARKATGKAGVIALEQSFHGRTTGSLAATGQPGKRAAFEPLLPGVRFAEPNDVVSLRAAAGRDVGLILLEPVLGEGGVIPLEPEFAAGAAELARSAGCTQAFRLGDRVWGVQFHPEVTGMQVEQWVADKGRTELDDDAVLAETRERIGEWNGIGRTLCEGFCELAERVGAGV